MGDIMKILVTGGRGFLGSYIIAELLKNDYEVIEVDNDSKSGKESISKLYDCSKVDHYKFDVSEREKLVNIMNGIDVVISGAALVGGIKYFHDYPFDIINLNNLSLLSVINAAIKHNVKQFILISSSMVYERATKFPVKEGDELEMPPPVSSYGFQKLCSEYIVKVAKLQYGLDYTIVRPFNAVGFGEIIKEPGFAHVMPDLILKIKKGLPIEIFGDGQQIRCFTHARDIAKGIALCVNNENAVNNDFNFVNENPIKIIDLAKLISKKLRSEEKFSCTNSLPFKDDVRIRDGAFDKASSILGWIPQITLLEMIDELIQELT